jgi:tape measure domain-containing protein
MAGNDVVGALYYKVVLDPRGFAKGVTSVKSEQDVLSRAIKSSVSEFDRLQAELDAIGSMYIKSKEEHRKELQVAQAEIIKQMEAIIEKKEQMAKLDEEKKAAKAAEEEEKRLDNIRQRYLAIARARKERLDAQVKAEEEANAKMLKAEKERVAEEKRLEKELAEYRKQRMGRRYEDLSRYFTSFGRFRILLKRLWKDVGNVNGGLSKMAGNLAQAAGMSPAMQGLARSLGAVGVKFLFVGAAITAFAKFMMSAIMAADRFRQQQIKLMPLLDNNASKTKMFMNEIMTLAAQTGFASQTMFELSESLLQLGVSAQNVPQVSKLLAGLAGGSEQRMKSIAKAYSDVMMKGRLMGQEALQFANAGIPIYKALADSMGVTAGQVRKMMEEGQISADQMALALTQYGNLRNIGGQIAENMKTVSGQFARIKTLVEQIMGSIGEGNDTALAKFLKLIGDALEGLQYMKVVIDDLLKERKGWMPNDIALIKNVLLEFYRKYFESEEEFRARMAEEQKRTEDELKKNAEDEQRTVKEREDAYQAASDYLKEQAKLTDEIRENQEKQKKFEEWLSTLNIDEKQKDLLRTQQAMLTTQQQYVETMTERIKLERESAEIAAKEEAERQRRAFAGATAKAGPSFDAGSRGEFNFLRDLLLGRRQNTEELRIMKEQEKALKSIEETSKAQLAELAEMSPDFVGPVMPVGGP